MNGRFIYLVTNRLKHTVQNERIRSYKCLAYDISLRMNMVINCLRGFWLWLEESLIKFQMLTCL